MKIAITADDNRMDTGVCPSFGRTPYYLIYDTENKKSIFLDNGAASSAGGAGIKSAQVLVDNKVEVVLAPRCGENAAQVLNGAGIKIYKTTDGLAMDNINLFLNGGLSILDNIHAGFHNHGNN